MLLTPHQENALHGLDRTGESKQSIHEFLGAVVASAATFFLPLPVECGITFHNQGQLVSVAQSRPVLEVMEEAQNPEDGGPVYNSLNRRVTTVVGDVTLDPRWPRYFRVVADHGYYSILSVCLVTTGATRATINFYAKPTDSFTADLRVAGERFAAVTAQHLRAHLIRKSALDGAAFVQPR